MRKILVIGVSILSVFILCSLSYQPIIADTSIENIPIIKESKTSNLDVAEIKELYNRLIEMKSQSNDDCGCEETTGWDFPIFCDILSILRTLSVYAMYILHIPPYIFLPILLIGSLFNCW